MSEKDKLLVLKESAPGEGRVSLVPQDVKKIIELGVEVYIESGAGIAAGHDDESYRIHGAQIRTNNGDFNVLLQDMDLIVRAKRPNKQREADEAEAFTKGQLLIGALDPFEQDGHIEAYKKAGIIAYSMDQLPLPVESPMNILASMSKIAGELAFQDALLKVQRSVSKVTIIGTGIAGKAAMQAALSKNLDTTVITTNADFFQSMQDSTYTTPVLMDKAAALSEQQSLVYHSAKVSDIVITSARSPGKKAPILLPANTLQNMPQGACVVDLALSEGGNVEGSHHDATNILGNDVLVTNVSGYPKAMPVEASIHWSLATRLFLEALLQGGNNDLISKAVIL